MSLHELRKRAEQCLASDAPTIAQAHTLAATALAVVRTIEASQTTGQPYREVPVPSASPLAVGVEALVALERALHATEERLRTALAEIASLKRPSDTRDA